MKMEVIFCFQDVSEIVKNGIPDETVGGTETQTAAHKDFKKNDCKALFIINQCLNSENFAKIRSAKSAKEAWDILEKSYAGADKVKRVKLQSLRKQFENLHMKEEENVADYFNRMQQLVNSMKTCNEVLSEQQIVEKILRSLPQKFDYICVAIEESRDVTKMKVEDLLNSLEAHEQRLKDRFGEKPQEQALQARSHHSKDGGKSKFQKGKERWKASKKRKEGFTRNNKLIPAMVILPTSQKERERGSIMTKEKFSAIIAPSLAIMLISVEVAKVESTSQMMRHMWPKKMVRILKKS